MFPEIPFKRVNWLVSSFLISTLFLSITVMPLYLRFFGIDWFQVTLFFVMLGACGFSITLGYHRLFSHLTFQAHRIVRLFTVVFGAGAFENSVLLWSCEHRSHHNHVDHDDDPYCIKKGFLSFTFSRRPAISALSCLTSVASSSKASSCLST